MIEKYEIFSNSYVVSNGKDAIIIDAGLSKNAASAIKNKYNIKAILLTHGHYDHIEGLKYFKDVDIYIHEDEEDFLYDSNLNLYYFMNSDSYTRGEFMIHKVTDGDIIDLIGYKFYVIHTPGHTKGSVCYRYENNLFTGDTLFNLSVGRTDFPTGSKKMLMDSIKKLKEINEDLNVYPGHNEDSRLFFEIENNPYFRG